MSNTLSPFFRYPTARMSMASSAALALLISLTSLSIDAAYTNHTVGGTLGWFFDASTNAASANFSDWAAEQTFALGDYLIFNTNTNQTVVQTYNLTTYANCTADFAAENDTTIYDAGSNNFGQPLTLAVPLTMEGANYFFSDAGDGFQCEHGMRFETKVVHGSGLPASLNQPPPPPPYTPGPAYEPSPVFQGTGGGKGQDLNARGFAVAAALGLVALL